LGRDGWVTMQRHGCRQASDDGRDCRA
jgi:hypothetical protein